MKKQFYFFLLLLIGLKLNGQKNFDFNTQCKQAYKEISCLKIESGLLLIEKEKQQNPNNLIPIYLESYIDLIEFFFNEDREKYEQKKDNISNRINLLKKGSKISPYYKFCLSNAYIHKSVISIRFGENLSAAWEARKAFLLIKENKKQFPNFLPNDLLLGSLNVITGTIPNGYKWIASIFGMKGSIKAGMKLLENFNFSTDSIAKNFNAESQLFYCYLNFHLNNKKDETIKYIQTSNFDLKNNHLFAYMASNLALNNKQSDYAYDVMMNRNLSNTYLQTTIWDMQLGIVKLQSLELHQAIQYFQNYLTKFKGGFYVKDTYQKLSWAYYLDGNYNAAQKARSNILINGTDYSEADKQAIKEAKQNKWPNTLLLKSRLLNDGGNNNEALKLLKGKSIENFEKIEEKLEFVYRLGRIYDDLNFNDNAIIYYKKAIEIGELREEHYASRAALQVGMIFEKKGNCNDAMLFYNKCLNMDDHNYKNSIDQRAKSGLSRCKGE